MSRFPDSAAFKRIKLKNSFKITYLENSIGALFEGTDLTFASGQSVRIIGWITQRFVARFHKVGSRRRIQCFDFSRMILLATSSPVESVGDKDCCFVHDCHQQCVCVCAASTESKRRLKPCQVFTSQFNYRQCCWRYSSTREKLSDVILNIFYYH